MQEDSFLKGSATENICQARDRHMRTTLCPPVIKRCQTTLICRKEERSLPNEPKSLTLLSPRLCNPSIWNPIPRPLGGLGQATHSAATTYDGRPNLPAPAGTQDRTQGSERRILSLSNCRRETYSDFVNPRPLEPRPSSPTSQRAPSTIGSNSGAHARR